MDHPPASNDSDASPGNSSQREVRYEHSPNLAEVLSEAHVSLLITTYQAGKVVLLGSHRQELTLSFHNFDRPMGVAVGPEAKVLAVAARNQVWLLRDAADVASQLDPPSDACLLTRSSHVTGEIQAHEMGWGGDELWVVNTLFSCLCTTHSDYSFVPRWQPRFISELKPEDRCHLNGLAMDGGRPRFVTAMAETNVAGGWRANKVSTGCLIDVESSETVVQGFAMPHSPRVHGDQIWLLDSGRGALVRVDAQRGQAETVARFPGYTRGLAIHGHLAFIGLSRIRETSTFGGVPIAEHRQRLKCGVAIVDLRQARLVGQFEFNCGVEEVFDVTIIPGKRHTTMRGPFAQEDGKNVIWTVPDPGTQ